MWSPLYNFWLHRCTERWERMRVVIVIILQFLLSKEIILWAGTAIKIQIAISFVMLKLPFQFFPPWISSHYPSLDAPQDTPSRLFSNIPIFSVKSCPNSPGWVLERTKHSSSKLWCGMTDSATDEPLLFPTRAHTAYIYPRGISWDNAVWIIVLSCSRGDKANLQFSSCSALAHEEILLAGKDIKILCQTGNSNCSLQGGNSTW